MMTGPKRTRTVKSAPDTSSEPEVVVPTVTSEFIYEGLTYRVEAVNRDGKTLVLHAVEE